MKIDNLIASKEDLEKVFKILHGYNIEMVKFSMKSNKGIKYWTKWDYFKFDIKCRYLK